MSLLAPFSTNRLNLRRPFMPRYQENSLLRGLKAWWNMDNATMAANYASDYGDFTLSHNATELTPNVDGCIGKCVQKTNGNYGYLYHNGTDLCNLEQFTCVVWLKFPEFPTLYEPNYRNPLAMGAQRFDPNLWRFRLIYSIPQLYHPSYPAGNIINLWLYYYDPTDAGHGYQPNFSILLEQPNTKHVTWLQNWHMLVCRYDGNTITGDAYYTGDDHFQQSREIGTLPPLEASQYYTFWPHRYMGCAALGDMFGVWDRALSESEIARLWNGGAGMAYPFN